VTTEPHSSTEHKLESYFFPPLIAVLPKALLVSSDTCFLGCVSMGLGRPLTSGFFSLMTSPLLVLTTRGAA
jgi:hypothetical protein